MCRVCASSKRRRRLSAFWRSRRRTTRSVPCARRTSSCMRWSVPRPRRGATAARTTRTPSAISRLRDGRCTTGTASMSCATRSRYSHANHRDSCVAPGLLVHVYAEGGAGAAHARSASTRLPCPARVQSALAYACVHDCVAVSTRKLTPLTWTGRAIKGTWWCQVACLRERRLVCMCRM